MIKHKLCIFFMLPFSFAAAQTKISGTVTGKEDGKSLAGINVTVKEKNQTGMLTYALTDEKGAYQLIYKNASDSVLITVSGFNMKKQSETIVNKSQILNFNIIAQAISLKEIKINPPKIRQLNDTLNYLVDGFSDKNDRTIGDVLKKMPGITVKDNGAILYNNKPINKFYIEDKDLLQGRYGIATNNIEFKDVATVQVLENHQPIKALKDREFTDEAAINLKLKDSAKGILTANAQLGTGLSPALWNNELFSMYFGKGRQNMNAYKGNNTGNDATAELNSLYSEGHNIKQGNSLYVQSPSPPSINQNRYLFNRAHAASVNNLWTYGKDYQLNANINYLNDRQEKEGYSRSVYYLPADSLLTIEEKLASTEHINLLDFALQLNTNKPQYYLDNSLKFTGQWSNEEGNVLKSESILQDLNAPQYKLSNSFNLIKNHKKLSFKAYSYNGYNTTNQTLGVAPLLYQELFNGHTTSNSILQSFNLNQFSSVNRVSFGINNGDWKQNYTLGAEVNLQHLKSSLMAKAASGDVTSTADSLNNDFQLNKYEVYFRPEYTYSKNKYRATVSFPVVYTYLLKNRLFFNPSFNIRYQLNSFWNLSASARYGNEFGGIESIYTGYIMHSYRNLVRNDGQLPEQKKQSYGIDVSYRHPIHAIFLNAGTNYFKNEMNLLYGYDYLGILSLRKSYNNPNSADGYNFFIRMSKGIDLLSSTISFEANYSNSAASQISQSEIVDFKSENYSITPKISSKISKWASFVYTFTHTQYKNKVSNGVDNFVPIYANKQHGQLNIFPSKGFIVNMTYENYYNSAVASGNRTMNFADIALKRIFKKMEFELQYANIFNTKQYISASYSDISTYYSAYNLRPAQVLMKIKFKIK